MLTFKITTVGASSGFVLPKEAMERMGVKKGDVLYAVEAPGGYLLTPYNPSFLEQIKMAEEVMHEDRDALRLLSK